MAEALRNFTDVIAFSLYGEKPRYVQPLLISADIRSSVIRFGTCLSGLAYMVFAGNAALTENTFAAEVAEIPPETAPITRWRKSDE